MKQFLSLMYFTTTIRGREVKIIYRFYNKDEGGGSYYNNSYLTHSWS
jgi:hypothetical protein